jgi:hypothetical protein
MGEASRELGNVMESRSLTLTPNAVSPKARSKRLQEISNVEWRIMHFEGSAFREQRDTRRSSFDISP